MGHLSTKTLDTAIVVITLVLTGYFLARGTNQVLASMLFASDAVNPTASTNPSAALAATGSLAGAGSFDPEPILKRNIFDSATGAVGLPSQASEEAEPAANIPFDPNAPPARCGGDQRLVATMVSQNNPALSVASIHGGGDGGPKNVREGMPSDAGEVLAIRARWVTVRPSGGVPCGLYMFGADDGAPAAEAPPPPPAAAVAEPPGERGSVTASDYDAGIRKVSDTKYAVSRSLLNRILADRAELIRAARVLPYEEGGRVVGVKLFGIRSTSLLGRIGLTNGDMLRTINGFDMTSPDSALEAYARLRTADRLSVSIVRNGQPVTMDYTVQ